MILHIQFQILQDILQKDKSLLIDNLIINKFIHLLMSYHHYLD
jgi:hypothetical protein